MWIINEQHLGPEYAEIVGQGQWGRQGDNSGQPPMGAFPFVFRLKDDDGELYFSGRYDSEAADADEHTWGGLDMAWKWGMAYAGATILEVRVDDVISQMQAHGMEPVLAARFRDAADADGWYVPFG